MSIVTDPPTATTFKVVWSKKTMDLAAFKTHYEKELLVAL